MRRAIGFSAFSAFAILLTGTIFVGAGYPYGQLTNDFGGTVTGDHWDLSAPLPDRTPGDGRTIIVHFGEGTPADRKAAIMVAHGTWEGITAVDFDDAPVFEPTGATLGDGFNTHVFNVILGGGVLAVTPNITVQSTGRILESDIFYGNSTRWDTSGNPRRNRVDVQSVAFHELGHLIGLSHSGVTDATMFSLIQSGIEARTPEPDDQISPVVIYGNNPGDVSFATGGISGLVIDGADANDGKLCALVFAFPVAEEPLTVLDQALAQVYSGSVVGDTVADNTSGATSGSYVIEGLPNGGYMVFLVPTGDGLINANQISGLCAVHAEADFPREFWNGASESNNEVDTFERVPVTVTGGLITTGIDFITETGAAGCVVDADCPAGQSCCGGACTAPVCSANADCADGDGCTDDTCTSPGTCAAACSNTPVACGADDGCCGPTCTRGTDLDCAATVCGNGVCEGGGEECFSCPADCACRGKNCKGCCGDGACVPPEKSNNCPVDCGGAAGRGRR